MLASLGPASCVRYWGKCPGSVALSALTFLLFNAADYIRGRAVVSAFALACNTGFGLGRCM